MCNNIIDYIENIGIKHSYYKKKEFEILDQFFKLNEKHWYYTSYYDNVIFNCEFSKLEYSICAELHKNRILLFFKGSKCFKNNMLSCYINAGFFMSIIAIFIHLLLLICDEKELINFTKGLLLNYNTEGIRNRNVFNKMILILTIHTELYEFLYKVCNYCEKNNINEIIIFGVSSGGSLGLFSLGEIAKICSQLNFKINLNFFGYVPAGVNSLMWKIIDNNLNNYLNKYNAKVKIENLIILGDSVSCFGFLFFNNKKIKNKLYIVNTENYKYWNKGQFITEKFYRSASFRMHNKFNYQNFINNEGEIYVIQDNNNINTFFNIINKNNKGKYNNKKLLDNFCKLNNINNFFFKKSIELENLQTLVNIYENKFIKIKNYKFYEFGINNKIMIYIVKFLKVNLIFNLLLIKVIAFVVIWLLFVFKIKINRIKLNKIKKQYQCLHLNNLIEKKLESNYNSLFKYL